MSFSWSFEEDKFLFEMSSLSKAKMKIHDYNGDYVALNKGVSLHELLYYIFFLGSYMHKLRESLAYTMWN